MKKLWVITVVVVAIATFLVVNGNSSVTQGGYAPNTLVVDTGQTVLHDFAEPAQIDLPELTIAQRTEAVTEVAPDFQIVLNQKTTASMTTFAILSGTVREIAAIPGMTRARAVIDALSAQQPMWQGQHGAPEVLQI